MAVPGKNFDGVRKSGPSGSGNFAVGKSEKTTRRSSTTSNPPSNRPKIIIDGTTRRTPPREPYAVDLNSLPSFNQEPEETLVPSPADMADFATQNAAGDDKDELDEEGAEDDENAEKQQGIVQRMRNFLKNYQKQTKQSAAKQAKKPTTPAEKGSQTPEEDENDDDDNSDIDRDELERRLKRKQGERKTGPGSEGATGKTKLPKLPGAAAEGAEAGATEGAAATAGKAAKAGADIAVKAGKAIAQFFAWVIHGLSAMGPVGWVILGIVIAGIIFVIFYIATGNNKAEQAKGGALQNEQAAPLTDDDALTAVLALANDADTKTEVLSGKTEALKKAVNDFLADPNVTDSTARTKADEIKAILDKVDSGSTTKEKVADYQKAWTKFVELAHSLNTCYPIIGDSYFDIQKPNDKKGLSTGRIMRKVGSRKDTEVQMDPQICLFLTFIKQNAAAAGLSKIIVSSIVGGHFDDSGGTGLYGHYGGHGFDVSNLNICTKVDGNDAVSDSSSRGGEKCKAVDETAKTRTNAFADWVLGNISTINDSGIHIHQLIRDNEIYIQDDRICHHPISGHLNHTHIGVGHVSKPMDDATYKSFCNIK